MKVAVVGAGKVGRALGLSWAAKGHAVTFGVLDASPDGLKQVHQTIGSGPTVASVDDAVAWAEVVLLAIPSKAILSAVGSFPSTAGKVLLDCSNPQSPANHGDPLPGLSLAEDIAKLAPEAAVVKIFNTVGFEVLANPDFSGVPATMFYCSNGESESMVAHQLAVDAGFDPVLVGNLAASPMLEELTRFWGALAYGRKLGRHLALKLLLK
jgi:predicted dinucleotide-binding enzyme